MDDKPSVQGKFCNDHRPNTASYSPHTCQNRLKISTPNTGTNIGARRLNLSGIIKSLEHRTAIAIKSLSLKGGAFSHPGPKEPSIQIPEKRGEQLTQGRPGHFPHTRDTLVRVTPLTHKGPSSRPGSSASPRAAGAQARLEAGGGAPQPQPGWRHRLRKARTAAAPPRCPQPPAAYGDALLCRPPRQRSSSSSRGVTLCSAPPAAPIGTATPRRLPASAAAAAAPSPTARAGRAPPAEGRAEGRGRRGRREAGSGDGARLPWLWRRGRSRCCVLLSSPQPGLSLSRGDLCHRRAPPVNGYVRNSGQRSPSELKIREK